MKKQRNIVVFFDETTVFVDHFFDVFEVELDWFLLYNSGDSEVHSNITFVAVILCGFEKCCRQYCRCFEETTVFVDVFEVELDWFLLYNSGAGLSFTNIVCYKLSTSWVETTVFVDHFFDVFEVELDWFLLYNSGDSEVHSNITFVAVILCGFEKCCRQYCRCFEETTVFVDVFEVELDWFLLYNSGAGLSFTNIVCYKLSTSWVELSFLLSFLLIFVDGFYCQNIV